MSRGGFKISQNKDEFYIDEGDKNLPSWLESFADQVGKNKTAVEVSRDRDRSSMFDQISSIMSGGRPSYATVESVVEDMQKRTGLADYLNKLHASVETNKNSRLRAAAQEITGGSDCDDAEIPSVLQSNKEMKQYIDDAVETRHGQIAAEAVLRDVESLFLKDVEYKELQSPELLQYIKTTISKARESNKSTDNYSSMGKGVGTERADTDDSSNTDAFNFANTAK